MPTKNCELGPGTLYFGETPVGKVQKASLKCEEPELSEDIEKLAMSFQRMGEATIEVSLACRRLAMLSLVHGRKVTNNWLKMHGGVMTRRWIK